MKPTLIRLLCCCALLPFTSLPGATGASAAPPLRPLSQGFDAANATAPMSAAAIKRAKAAIDPWLGKLPDVPVPRDPGGGYTHERHKDNYRIIRDAGALFALTKNPAYARLVRDILLKYAALYPGLGLHPVTASSQRGTLFWQSLNDSVWLVESIKGYDAVRSALTPEERTRIERDVLRPMAEFLSTRSAATFDRIHNHGTWAVAAVGMTGYVIGDATLVKRALYGLDGSGKSGFLRQIDQLFSPDGYYTEGPYYQRYALQPFIDFARMIDSHDPQLGIFERRDRVLLKAVINLVQETYAGRFFPLNDSIREKSLDTPELVSAVAVAYSLTADPALLSVAKLQGQVALSADGVALGAALEHATPKPFPFHSVLLRDGADGSEGALAILRSGPAATDEALVFKATAQGMEHGHFDRLSWTFYDAGREVVADYGAARFLNVEAKSGGRYLPENDSWANQTIAHNTLVVDQTSQFGGKLALSEAVPTKVLHYSNDSMLQIAAARLDDAYPGLTVWRAVALLDRPELGHPIVLDLLRARGAGTAHRFDLPVFYKGAWLDSTLKFSGGLQSLVPLGAHAGYQHLWDRGRGTPVAPGSQTMNWFNEDRFYSYRFASPEVQQVILVELGANDPHYNLRHERAFIMRADNAREFNFAAVLEAHGDYNAAEESVSDATAKVKNIRLVQDGARDLVVIETLSGTPIVVGVSWDPASQGVQTISDGATQYRWSGFAAFATKTALATPVGGTAK